MHQKTVSLNTYNHFEHPLGQTVMLGRMYNLDNLDFVGNGLSGIQIHVNVLLESNS